MSVGIGLQFICTKFDLSNNFAKLHRVTLGEKIDFDLSEKLTLSTPFYTLLIVQDEFEQEP